MNSQVLHLLENNMYSDVVRLKLRGTAIEVVSAFTRDFIDSLEQLRIDGLLSDQGTPRYNSILCILNTITRVNHDAKQVDQTVYTRIDYVSRNLKDKLSSITLIGSTGKWLVRKRFFLTISENEYWIRYDGRTYNSSTQIYPIGEAFGFSAILKELQYDNIYQRSLCQESVQSGRQASF